MESHQILFAVAKNLILQPVTHVSQISPYNWLAALYATLLAP
uniref:Uncharacterized protein n=1 Tax=Arundo donax TaxID=35708 RepID=A0A0A8XUH6_ARUDO